MPTLLYTALLLAVAVISYIWVSTPTLSIYTLQLFAFGIICFTVIKKFRTRKSVQLTTTYIPYELLALLGCILIFIGTNQTQPALLYPVICVALFFFVFFSSFFSAVMSSAIIAIFILLTQTFVDVSNYSLVLMIPLLFGLFAFTKKQYDLVKLEKDVIAEEELKIEALTKENNQLRSFISDYLQPKLELMQDLATKPEDNCDILQSQLALLENEMEKQVKKIPTEPREV